MKTSARQKLWINTLKKELVDKDMRIMFDLIEENEKLIKKLENNRLKILKMQNYFMNWFWEKVKEFYDNTKY